MTGVVSKRLRSGASEVKETLSMQRCNNLSIANGLRLIKYIKICEFIIIPGENKNSS